MPVFTPEASGNESAVPFYRDDVFIIEKTRLIGC